MTDSDRRSFIVKSATVVSAASLSGVAFPAKAGGERTVEQGSKLRLDQEMLRAVGQVVLPAAALGEDGVTRVVADFERWLAEYEPVPELNHGYLNRGLAEIRYGPPDPGPRWSAQLEALDIEAQKRFGKAFPELQEENRRSLISRQIRRDPLERLPNATQARHVAVGLLAYFYATPEANDLCHEVAIRRYTCRGLEEGGEKPAPLREGG